MNAVQSRRLFVGAMLSMLALLVTACEEHDATSVTIKIKDDLSGTVRVSSLQVVEAPTAIEGASQRVTWDGRAKVECSTGSFAALGSEVMRIADITVEARSTASGRSLHIRLPRGKSAQWPRLLAPVAGAADALRQVAAAKPEDAKDLGKFIKLVVEVPREPVAHGVRVPKDGKPVEARAAVSPPSPKIESKVDENVCTLLVPVAEVSRGDDVEALSWHISW